MAREGTGRRGRRDLTRSEILEAAVELAERDGAEALSMRRVAAAVGVEAMSLYNHVRDKEALIDGVVDTVLGRLELPAPRGAWRDDARALADAFRAHAHRYPRTAPLVLTRQSYSPALLAAADGAVGILLEAGFTPADAVRGFRSLLATVVGSLLRELGASPTLGGDDPRSRALRDAVVTTSGLPHLPEVAGELAALDHDADFAFAVDLVLDALAARLANVP